MPLPEDTALIEELSRRFKHRAKRKNHLLIDLTTIRNHIKAAVLKAVKLSDESVGQWYNVRVVEAAVLDRCLALLNQALELHQDDT